MFSCQKLWCLLLLVIFLKTKKSFAQSVTETFPETNTKTGTIDLTKRLHITDDVIADKVEKDQKKVIRINPVDLPAVREDANIYNMDSSLYNIHSLKPYTGKRTYIDMRRPKPPTALETHSTPLSDTPIIKGFSILQSPQKPVKPKHQPKRKPVHFTYNQEDLVGKSPSKTIRVHVAPGPHPVYYIRSKTNGRFGKYPLKSFGSPQDFKKYLQKNKLQNLLDFKTYEKAA